ncbi:MAG: HD domain-containing protein [Bacteroidota bacterium]
MKTRISQWISASEEKWLVKLQPNAAEVFSGIFLPSHDQDHHLRVWQLCKTLLGEISLFNSSITPDLVEGVMVAAWFHDLGMAQSTEESHGVLGKAMCKQFFSEKELPLPLRFDEICTAVEKHDSKDESVYDAFVAGSPPGVLNILSIADDLDALGVIGIYRYVEIYLHRRIPMGELGISVLKNATTRYRNIRRCLSNCPALAESSERDFTTLVNFFNLYNQQLVTLKEPEKVLWGHLGIVNHIRRFNVEGKVRPRLFLEAMDGPVLSQTVRTYFEALKNALELV